MLSEIEIEALKKGAYGVSRDGRKARYIGENKNGSPIIARFCEDGTFDSVHVYATSFFFSVGIETHLDIVGLWENKPEPFNLDRALAGDLVINDAGFRFWVVKKSNVSDQYITEFMDGSTGCQSLENLNKCYMYKDDADNRSGMVTLPTPIKDFGDLEKVWYVNKTKDRYAPYGVTKNGDWLSTQYTSLSRGCYYATEEDCRAVCDWLMNR